MREMALMAQRTPESYIHGDAHQLFCSGRVHLVYLLPCSM